MSGIVGIVNPDGALVDAALLGKLTQSLAFRGPDGQHTWANGPAGFGWAFLYTGAGGAINPVPNEQQPISLEGDCWIAADARLDARAELVRELHDAGRQDVGHHDAGRNKVDHASDAELILHAYHAWGENCPQHLLGDFAFAIWDPSRQRLFAARDHFGVKPFYYAHVGSTFIFSNTLTTLRRHPGVTDALNDLAVADFLLIGHSREPNTTSFQDILRLPAAHILICDSEGVCVKPYWSLPVEEMLRYKRESDYVEHFLELFDMAVRDRLPGGRLPGDRLPGDRLRADRISVRMSGGLDSSSVAATVRYLSDRSVAPLDIHAFTVVFDRLIPDTERHWAGRVADGLHVPITYLAADDYRLFGRWENPDWRLPEPVSAPTYASWIDHVRQVSAHSRVALSGDGGDPGFSPEPMYLVNLAAQGRFGSLFQGVSAYVRLRRRLPPLYFVSWLRRKMGWKEAALEFPPWLNSELVARYRLRERYEHYFDAKTYAHPVRPEAYQEFSSIYWANTFEEEDAGFTGVPWEVRYPFFDLRVVKYLLRVPPVPWCAHKELLRQAMRGRLPEAVRLRPKAPLAGDPVLQLVKKDGISIDVDSFASTAWAHYIDVDAYEQVLAEVRGGNNNGLGLIIAPYCLGCWLNKLLVI